MANVSDRKQNTGGFFHVPRVQAHPGYGRLFLSYVTSLPGEGFIWSMKSVLVATAVLLYVLTPTSLDFASFGWQEASFLWLRNAAFFILCTAGLHLYFHSFRAQGDRYRYFQKDIGKKSEFTFGSQLRDNVFWCLASGVTVWSLMEYLYFYFYAHGWMPRVEFGTSVGETIWFILLLILIPHIQAFHFFAYHRPLHWPPLYRHVHALHHRNISLIPWSGISMHPVEHLLYLCPGVVFFFLPSHPIHMLFFMHYLTVGASFSHAGYERLQLWGNVSFPIAGFYHQLHHRLYNCNYGNPDFPLDELAGCNETGARFVN